MPVKVQIVLIGKFTAAFGADLPDGPMQIFYRQRVDLLITQIAAVRIRKDQVLIGKRRVDDLLPAGRSLLRLFFGGLFLSCLAVLPGGLRFLLFHLLCTAFPAPDTGIGFIRRTALFQGPRKDEHFRQDRYDHRGQHGSDQFSPVRAVSFVLMIGMVRVIVISCHLSLLAANSLS